jgi:hypothetical protein
VASVDKAKLLAKLIERLRARVKPASLPGPQDQTPAAAEAALNGTEALPAAPQPSGPDIFHGDPVLKEFVRSFLIWESTTAKADTALKRVASAVVDLNEFRVCLPAEMAAAIGPNYPRIEERVAALRAALNDLFKRENRLRLAHLPGLSKKQASTFLDAFAQNPPTAFATRRIALLCCQVHTLPVDGRIADVLHKAKIAETGASIEDTAAATTRLLKAGEARDAYAILQAAADEAPVTPTRVPKAVKPAPAKQSRPKPKATTKKSK